MNEALTRYKAWLDENIEYGVTDEDTGEPLDVTKMSELELLRLNNMGMVQYIKQVYQNEINPLLFFQAKLDSFVEWVVNGGLNEIDLVPQDHRGAAALERFNKVFETDIGHRLEIVLMQCDEARIKYEGEIARKVLLEGLEGVNPEDLK